MPRRMGVALSALAQAKSGRRTVEIFRLGRKNNLFSAIPKRRTGRCILAVKQVAYMQHTSHI